MVAATAEDRAKRRQLTEHTAALAERIHGLPEKLQTVVTSTAEAHKNEGNGHFKKGEYEAAAISQS